MIYLLFKQIIGRKSECRKKKNVTNFRLEKKMQLILLVFEIIIYNMINIK